MHSNLQSFLPDKSNTAERKFETDWLKSVWVFCFTFVTYSIKVIVGNFWQVLNYMDMDERLNIQVDKGQSTNDSRILTHNLCSSQPGKQKYYNLCKQYTQNAQGMVNDHQFP